VDYSIENFSFAGEMTYVNLLLNPERYTGYTGPSARRIWDAIYSENCPKCEFHADANCPFILSSFHHHFGNVLKRQIS